MQMYNIGRSIWARTARAVHQRSMQPGRPWQRLSRGGLGARAAATSEAVSAPSDEGSRLDGKLKIIGGRRSLCHKPCQNIQRLLRMPTQPCN
jgi:hypothetical protein